MRGSACFRRLPLATVAFGLILSRKNPSSRITRQSVRLYEGSTSTVSPFTSAVLNWDNASVLTGCIVRVMLLKIQVHADSAGVDLRRDVTESETTYGPKLTIAEEGMYAPDTVTMFPLMCTADGVTDLT